MDIVDYFTLVVPHACIFAVMLIVVWERFRDALWSREKEVL